MIPVIVAGGTGSGWFGPPRGSHIKQHDTDRAMTPTPHGTNYFVTPDGKFIDVADRGHFQTLVDAPGEFGVDVSRYESEGEVPPVIDAIWEQALGRGFVRAHRYRGELGLQTDRLTDRALHRLQGLITSGKINRAGLQRLTWEGYLTGERRISADLSEFLQADRVRDLVKRFSAARPAPSRALLLAERTY